MRLTIFICFLFTTINLPAQVLGANRNNIDWKVIKTPAANVIFAPEMEAKANRVANIVNYMRDNNSLSIGPKKHKIDILIRNESIIPNAYVALGPFRSEFYVTPPDRFNDIGATDWVEHLAIHEYRHVMQAANEKVGLTKFIYYLTGESGWNGMKFLSIPQWVSEGDAVIMETSLTKSGRGRMPYFTRGLRALALENKNYDYHKWSNGSFDELIPNRYPFGYMLLSYLRNNKGSEISGDIIRSGASYSKIFYPYSSAMKSKTGWSTTGLYRAAWKNFGNQWREEVNSLVLTPTKKITQNPEVVSNYHFPQFTGNDKIIALKSSFRQTEKIVNVQPESDQAITAIGFSYSDYFNYQNGVITWTEYSQNARRFNTQYSNIYKMDLGTSEKTKLTEKGKYFSPYLSQNALKIVAIHIDGALKNTLHILNAENGNIEYIHPVDKGASITRSIFTNGDQAIAYIIKKDNYIWIESLDLESKNTVQLSPRSSHVIDAIAANKNFIYYSASYTGVDNIFRVALDGSRQVEQITSVPVGAYEPSLSSDGNTLLFTEFTTRGQMISTMDIIQTGQSNFLQIKEPVEMEWMDQVSAREEGGEILAKVDSSVYKKEDYNGLFKGLKLHSWLFSPTSSELIGGLQFNNILDDFSIFAGGGYNQNEERGFYLFNTKISKYYPVYEFQAETRGRSTINFTRADTFAIQRFEEFNMSANVSLPFSWVSGNYFKNLRLGIGAVRHNLYNTKIKEVSIDNSSVTTSNLYLQFSNLRRRAIQNVRPRLGYSFAGQYTINITHANESKIIGTSRIYLPGLDYNHSLLMTFSYQKELAKNTYQLSDNFGYPRGYRAPLNDETYKIGMDYMFPVAYPDIGLLGLVYLKRLRINLFYDVGQFQYKEANFTDDFQSIGTDFYFDITTFNLIPSSFVIRYSYRLTANIIDPTGGEFRFFTFINF